MPQIINTNIASLTAQRNLNSSQNSLNTSLQRLSSGLRINSAKDDAAGLAISERFTTQIRGLNQASRNANDAISLSQTAEGALGEIGSNLQRIRELAVQSANATNSASDRAALDLEVQQRLAEVDRIASSTSFNGQKIIDGSFGTAAFQVGANVGETITLDLTTSMRQDQLGAYTNSSSVDLTTVITDATPAVAGSYTSGDLSSLDFSTTAAAAVPEVFTATNAYAGVTSFDFQFTTDQVSFDVSLDGGTTTDTVTLNSNTTNEAGFLAEINSQISQAITVSVSGGDLVFTADTGAAANDIVVDNFDGDVDSGNNTVGDFVTGSVTTPGADAVVTSNVVFDVDGDTVTLNGNYTDTDALVTAIEGQLTNASEYTVLAVDADTFSITSNTAGTASSYDGVVDNFQTTSITGASGGTSVAAADVVAGSTVTVNNDFSIQIGTAAAVNVANATYSTNQSLVDAVNTALAGNAQAVLNDDNTMSIIANDDVTVTGTTGLTTLGYTGTVAASGNLTTATVTTVDASNDAIRRIDASLTSISDLRSTFGAIQNRFESTISNLDTAVESLSAARSRIQDADFASETAALTRAQILQQAGVSILSQANSLPQSVLGLLQ